MSATAIPRTVLIADDTAFVRDRFQQALERGGHRAVTAASGAELLARLRDAHRGIDLILLDLRLPHRRGLRLLQAIQSVNPTPPVVVFSGTLSSAAEVRELGQLGVAGFVNEYAGVQHILPALFPHLDPDHHACRQFPRAGLDVPVTYRYGSTVASAIMLNISEGGVAVRTTNPPEPDNDVRVRFRLPRAAHTIEATVRVVWRNSRLGMGLQFTHISGSDRTAIGEFVQPRFFTSRKG